MNPQAIWDVFVDTGAPEMYLLYNKMRKAETIHVFDHTGACPESNEV